jgi:hypothetical protein
MLMTSLYIVLTALAACLALMSLGGGLYEYRVVDPAWPGRPDLIQPQRGGVSRRRFWIPAHVAFEIALIGALFATWPQETIRDWLLLGLASYAAMRIWSAFDFIPKALGFERKDPDEITKTAARRWTRRSLLRLPLDLVTCGATVLALVAAARLS